MEVFSLTLRQMLMMFTLIVAGVVLRKKRLLPENAHIVMSRLETYVLVPALLMYAQFTKCTPETFRGNSYLLWIGALISLAGLAAAYLLAPVFVRRASASPERAYLKNLYTYALAVGNYASVGNFIILGIWGTDLLYRYTLYTFFVGILCNSWGLYMLIPKGQNSGMKEKLKKGILSPPLIALVIGMVVGLMNLTPRIPDFLMRALENAGNCQGPVAMLLAGFVIGGYDFRELVSDGKVLLMSLCRLIFIPAAMLIVLRLVGADTDLMLLTLLCFATPVGLNTIVFPAAYGGDTRPGASMAMISHVLSVITIPLMVLLFIGAV